MEYLYNGQELTARQIKRLNPNVSYTNPTQIGAVFIQPAPSKPAHGALEKLVADGTEVINGNLVRKYKVVDMFSDTFEDGVLVPKTEYEARYLVTKQAKELEDLNKAIKTTVTDAVNAKAEEDGFDNIDASSKFMGWDNSRRARAEKLAQWCVACWETVDAADALYHASGTLPTVEGILGGLPEYTQEVSE